ncbi:unnamed protein product (macronuclear) [Paramecium tetraurelia]|uniref:UBC core domain-containing protein n=1 Tax=Paramecium tetraurelia TaxID=5888 RepID=A0BUQ2_PARTE|nr:uncharacterized protein GSPATT00005515001 [Paramecium tetraurelia]CAK62269.1 unnamed protein product [Paramecium tetraurelia]|eukprot:XP_001429667.1 hypothetical protein (macronuclear) [Paramecium tetraurelia strain d4-2]
MNNVIKERSKKRNQMHYLLSIYQTMSNLKDVHPYSFQVIVAPFVPADQFYHDNVVYCKIFVAFPDDYPLKSQRFHFEIQGLSRNFTQDNLIRARKVCESVIDHHEKEADSQPIVFAVVEALRDYVFDQSMYLQELYDQQNSKPDDNYIYIPPMPKFATNTPLWKKKFDQEIYEIKKREKNFNQVEEMMKKISGKQYFDRKQNKEDDVDVQDIINEDDDIVELEDEDYQGEEYYEEDQDRPLYEREQLE